MTAERWRAVKKVFASALELPAEARSAFLDNACAGDESLRHEVESLLASHQQAADFIETPAHTTGGMSSEKDADDPDIGRRIGAYRTVQEIGRGGMGSVYLAVRADEEFERRVAIKLVRRGMEIDFIIRRFRNERQILANLDHPYIARLLDGGSTSDGLPYFVMEYVDGRPLHRYAEEQQLSAADRLKLFEKVCSAVEYAHEHQVIHRDLKPGNILVTAGGIPKLLDFGIAKLLDPDVSTTAAEPTTASFRLMTPAYASPEQLRGQVATASSDIYSLGILLHELVTGHRPEKHGWSLEDFSGSYAPLPAGLQLIVDKATEERPRDRYASVAEFARDIHRYLEGQPVFAAAQPPARPKEPETTPTTGPRTIAILPFQMVGVEDKSDEYLGTGMADSLITKLSNIRRIIVRPTSAVLRYTRGIHNLEMVARELGVRYVLDGRIRRVGDRVRVTVQLVRDDGAPLWAAKFDEKFTDILNLEDSLSEQVARALIERLTQEEREALHKRGTDSAEAYQAYLKGRYYWSSYTEEALSKAIVSFMEALALDPAYAQAQAGVADYHNWLGVWNVLPPEECFAAAKDAARKALELDPLLAEAHASFGFATWAYDRDWGAAERSLRRAIELNPDYPAAHQWCGYLLSARGRHEEAIAQVEEAMRLYPLSAILGAATALVYYNARRYETGLEKLQQASQAEPHQYIVQQGQAWLYGRLGRHQEAIDAARRALGLAPGVPLLLWTLGSALAGAGREKEALEIVAELGEVSERRYVSPYFTAVIYALLGKAETALDWLEKADSQRDWWLLWMGVEPRLDNLRREVRFQKLLTAVGLGAGGPATVETGPTLTVQPASPAMPSHSGSRLRTAVAVAILAALAIALVMMVRTAFLRKASPLEKIRIAKLTTNGYATNAGISPDGKYVAYAVEERGRQSIWVRQKSVAVGVQIVPPADSVFRGLTFSRDGTSLYYVVYERNDQSHGALYQVAVLGGPQKKLIEDVESSVALSPDGRQAAFIRSIAAETREDLIVAGLDGGGQRRLASRKQPEQFAYSSAPAWSPDGKTIVAAVENPDARGRYVGLVAISVKNGAEKIFSPKKWLFVERIAWLNDGSGIVLVGQEPEATFQQVWEVRANGMARTITNDLNDYIGVSLTADSKELVTVQFAVLSNLWVAPGSDANRASQITAGAGRYYDLAWTPDGKLLYSSDASNTVDLWMREPDGTGARQLTFGARRNYGAAVSPDGAYIAFHSNRTGNWNVWRINRDGSNPVPLTQDNKTESNWPQFSRDGRWVIFQHAAAGGTLPLWKVPVQGGVPTRITQETCMRPAVSPVDGKIACWSSEAGPKPHWRIGVFPADGGPPLRMFEFPSSVSVESALDWTADGRAISFVDNRSGASNIWLQPADGAPAQPITAFKSAQLFSVAWSHNGRLAFSRGMQASDAVLISGSE